MPELLVELGCEELPATFVRKATQDLLANLTSALTESGLILDAGVAYGTPRRLIVSFANLRDRQEDVTKDQRGPSVKAAFDAEGKPTGALLGFLRGQGLDISAVRQEGDYAWVTKTIPGRDAAEVLAEVIPQAIKALTFEKSMRWGSARMRFARPIRWILASFGGNVVPFDVETVSSGLDSRGHRFYSPAPFVATNLVDLLAGLRERKVEVDEQIRRQLILDGAKKVAGGTPDLSDALVDENTFLTEWPTAVSGTFKEEFMVLPEPVLVTAMAKHEKMFPVRGDDGKLLNRFVFVRNSGEDETVVRGNQWVLNARFNDAKFFFEEDQKSTFADFLDKTSGILFQEKLGTVRQRADRLSSLAAEIAKATGADDAEVEYARLAGLYAKADLSTGLVSELSSLQGIIGGEYARRAGLPEPVCHAIATQYDLSKNANPTDAAGRTAVRLVLADQLDKLAGYLGLGLEPTGSSDPFGLRRAVTQLIEAAWNWPAAMPAYDQLLEFALAEFKAQGVELSDDGAYAALSDIFSGRYPALMSGVRHDVLNAAMLADMRWELAMPQGVRLRAGLLASLVDEPTVIQTATRPLNIVAAAKKKGIAYGFEDPLAQVKDGDLDSEDGLALLKVLKAQEETVFKAAREHDGETLLKCFRALLDPINAFFDKTMVMVDDESIRFARLTLLHAASLQILAVGNVTALEG